MNPKRTEIPGYINQLSIQLNRWQLRLQTSNERKKELAAKIDGIQKVAQELGQSYRTFSANQLPDLS
jgi:chaperonin cofactor prefoldin